MTKARVKFSLRGMHRKVRKWRGKGERRKGTPFSVSFPIHAFLPPPLQFSFEAACRLSKIRLKRSQLNNYEPVDLKVDTNLMDSNTFLGRLHLMFDFFF